MKLSAVSAVIVVFLGGSVSRQARAQADPLELVLRPTLVDVAEASGMPRLDSATLSPGVRREIRIYTGFGLGFPNEVVRLWQDDRGTHGQLGVFWPTGMSRTPYPSPDEERRRREELREPGARMRAHVDTTYNCPVVMQSRTMNVCWLPERRGAVSWMQLLSQLDRLGVDSIPSPANRRLGLDGWMVVVEVRRTMGYRWWSYWAPEASSTDPGERVAAEVATVVRDAFRQRLVK